MGASVLVLRMVACSENDQLFKAGLQLGIALLGGGNFTGLSAVQDSLHQTLTGSTDGIILPMDGSSSNFLSTLRMRLRLAKKEVSPSNHIAIT